MSRDEWCSNLRGGREVTSNAEFLATMKHKWLAGRTSDPEAEDFDEAVAIFLQGVTAVRNGDFVTACGGVATAFLLDSRSVKVSMFASQDPQVQARCLDMTVLYTLSQTNKPFQAVSFGGHVIRMLLAQKLGDSPMGQSLLGQALLSANFILQALKEHPDHGRPGGVLGGCMTPSNIYFHRSCVHMAMGNRSKAIADLTKALDIDPKHIKSRDARASLWASLGFQDQKTVFEEYKKIVEQVHPDYRGLEVAYAWMALYILQDPAFGTFQEAKVMYEKCLRASARKLELYGVDRSPPPILETVKELLNDGEKMQLRKNADIAFAALPAGFVSMKPPATKSTAHACLTCGKTALEQKMEALFKCKQCKKVSYCSKECQRKDWKEVRTGVEDEPRLNFLLLSVSLRLSAQELLQSGLSEEIGPPSSLDITQSEEASGWGLF